MRGMDSAQLISSFKDVLQIEAVAETGSTNADLLARVGTLGGPVVLIAERQTAGRGRAGRAWHAAPGATLTFSLAWSFAKGPAQLLGLPLAVGVGLAEALAGMDVPVQLKWPNDVLKGGNKLAGILVETARAPAGLAPAATWAVIGVGLNLQMPDSLEQRIGHQVAAAPWLAQMPREQLMAVLLGHLAAALRQFDNEGFAAFQSRWNTFYAYREQWVEMREAGQLVHQGRSLGVDELGRLLLETAAGRIAVMAGDISLRPAEMPS